jgi:hypothetical protein
VKRLHTRSSTRGTSKKNVREKYFVSMGMKITFYFKGKKLHSCLVSHIPFNDADNSHVLSRLFCLITNEGNAWHVPSFDECRAVVSPRRIPLNVLLGPDIDVKLNDRMGLQPPNVHRFTVQTETMDLDALEIQGAIEREPVRYKRGTRSRP